MESNKDSSEWLGKFLVTVDWRYGFSSHSTMHDTYVEARKAAKGWGYDSTISEVVEVVLQKEERKGVSKIKRSGKKLSR